MTRLPTPRDRHAVSFRSSAPFLAAHILHTGRQRLTRADAVRATNPALLTAIDELGRRPPAAPDAASDLATDLATGEVSPGR